MKQYYLNRTMLIRLCLVLAVTPLCIALDLDQVHRGPTESTTSNKVTVGSSNGNKSTTIKTVESSTTSAPTREPFKVLDETNGDKKFYLNQTTNKLTSSQTAGEKKGNVSAGVVKPKEEVHSTTSSSTTEKTVENATQISKVTPQITTNSSLNITSTTATSVNEPVLPEKGSAEAEHNSSMAIFFVLCVLALGILVIHFMLMTNFQYLPESIAIVFLGGLIGLILNLMSDQIIGNWRKEEAFSPTAFFLVLLPPIIFESGYNLHKGNFFQNIGSILVFAIVGTTISAVVIGGGVYLLGLADVAYRLNFTESMAFGSLISAVDPVATVSRFMYLFFLALCLFHSSIY